MDLRLLQIMMKPDITFGGVCVFLIGDTNDLPPVIRYSFWDPKHCWMWKHKANIYIIFN